MTHARAWTDARGVLAAVAAAVWLVAAPRARTEPRFAVREGLQCAHCHVNRSGGGMRTPYGTVFAQTNLVTFVLEGTFDPHAGETLSFGGNLRVRNRTVLETHTELDDQQYEAKASNTFDMPEGNLYVRADVVPGWLSVYWDETLSPEGASAREAFVLLEGLPAGLYVKAGRMLLPFGLRLPDDTAFVRAQTGFNYANQDLGIEIGIQPDPVSVSVALINGSLGAADTNLLKQVTARTEVVWDWGRFGLSVSWNDTSTEDFPFESLTTAAYGGVRLGRLLLLAELDWIRGMGDAETYDQLALYTEVDYEAIEGLYLRFMFEAFDPLLSLDENERDRFTGAVSWFPLPFLEVWLAYRANRDIPQRVEGNADEILFEIHGFL